MSEQMSAETSEASLDIRLVQDVKGTFRVPAYQRGYRWGKHEVRCLLDDIWERAKKPDGSAYSLQPVVVKQDGDKWELVDGQQRLTTLYLLFRYMHRERLKASGPRYSIVYDTRPGSEEYLRDLDPALREKNIDFSHLAAAHDCIHEWFSAFEDRQLVADKLYPFLLEQVGIVWYVAPAGVDGPTLFTRLNVGRIPLTDAELVKALLLTRIGRGPGGKYAASEAADQWDAIERDLRDPDVWAFVGDVPAEDRPTRITLLLDSVAGQAEGPERPLFFTFDSLQGRMSTPDAAKRVWDEVLDLHAMLRGWYDDRALYHKVGYLVQVGEQFSDIVKMAEGIGKSAFERRLTDRIRERLDLTWSRLRELSYESGYAKCRDVLLLMNVEATSRVIGSTERYSFHQHRLGSWSLEHIHAQQAEGLTKEAQWSEWLHSHRKALESFPATGKRADLKSTLLKRIEAAERNLTRESFAEVSRPVSEFFTLLAEGDATSDGLVHSIANLALLDSTSNSVLNNSVFAVKRERILERDREGSYIPVCTRRVFLKYYTAAEDQQIHFWGPQDQAAYLEAIKEAVGRYLREEG